MCVVARARSIIRRHAGGWLPPSVGLERGGDAELCYYRAMYVGDSDGGGREGKIYKG